ncbi:MAG: hypothetical protein AB8I69_20995 [Anaerolineae bacterium]
MKSYELTPALDARRDVPLAWTEKGEAVRDGSPPILCVSADG